MADRLNGLGMVVGAVIGIACVVILLPFTVVTWLAFKAFTLLASKLPNSRQRS